MRASAFLAALLLAPLGTARAQTPSDVPATGSNAEEVARAKEWASQLWKEALPVAKRAAERARAFSSKAEQALAQARTAREAAETELATLRDQADAARKSAEEMRAKTASLRAEAESLRPRLALAEDARGELRAAVESAARQRLPQETEEVAARAERDARAALGARRAELRARLAREAAAAATSILAADLESLKLAALGAASRLAQARLTAAAKTVTRALTSAARRRKAALVPAREARRALEAVLPTAGEIQSALERRVREIGVAAGRALLEATWNVRRIPAASGETPRTALVLAALAGAQLAAEAVLDAGPPAGNVIAREAPTAVVAEQVLAAVAFAREKLEARRAEWSRALEALEKLAEEEGK
jgi:chaperonin cofactor prefoldin